MADAAANVLELPATEHFRSFEHAFKDVWGNNADAISLLYRYKKSKQTNSKQALAGWQT